MAELLCRAVELPIPSEMFQVSTMDLVVRATPAIPEGSNDMGATDTLTERDWPSLKIRHDWPARRFTVTQGTANLREEPNALTRTFGFVRGAQRNLGSYRAQQLR